MFATATGITNAGPGAGYAGAALFLAVEKAVTQASQMIMYKML